MRRATLGLVVLEKVLVLGMLILLFLFCKNTSCETTVLSNQEMRAILGGSCVDRCAPDRPAQCRGRCVLNGSGWIAVYVPGNPIPTYPVCRLQLINPPGCTMNINYRCGTIEYRTGTCQNPGDVLSTIEWYEKGCEP